MSPSPRNASEKESERTKTDLDAYEKDNLASGPDDVGLQAHEDSTPFPRRAGPHGPALALILARRACPWAALGLLAALATIAPPARAAVTEAWVHRYNPMVNSIDEAFKVVSDAAGDIIVAGSTDDGLTGSDMLTIKYSGADGTVLWQKRFNGPANSYDYANAIAVDGSGNVVVTGTSYGSRSDPPLW